MKNLFPVMFWFSMGAICIISMSSVLNRSFDYNDYYTHKCMKSKVSISKSLIPYFNSFIKDSKSHGFNPKHVYCLESIGFKIDYYNLQGLTCFDDGTININKNLLSDTIGMKFVVYHEIGHWLGLSHDECTLMTRSYGTESDSGYVKANWKMIKNEYFEKLKQIN